MVNILFSMYNFDSEWAKQSIKQYISKNNSVCIIPFSFDDKKIKNKEDWHKSYDKNGGKYYYDLIKPFLSYEVAEDNISMLNYFEDSTDKMKEMIEKSDVLFLTGGLPDKAVERVIEKGVLDVIKKSKVIVGSSAGALMQFNNYYVSPDDDYDEFTYFKGLGLIDKDFYIEVHYENTEVQNKSIEKALNEKTDAVYAISNNGGIIIDKGNIELLGKVDLF